MIHIFLLVVLLNGNLEVRATPSLEVCEQIKSSFISEAPKHNVVQSFGAECIKVELKPFTKV